MTTQDLARHIAAHERFTEPGETFFDDLADEYGRNETAVAWVLALLEGEDLTGCE